MPMKKRSSRTPRVTTRCGANAYTGSEERIIEFSFPARAKDDGTLPGGLIRFHNRDRQDGRLPLVEVYRTEKQVEVIAPRTCCWAAFAGSALGQEISLHAEKRDALVACCEVLQISIDDGMDDEDLENALSDHCSRGADDWCVQEVQLP